MLLPRQSPPVDHRERDPAVPQRGRGPRHVIVRAADGRAMLLGEAVCRGEVGGRNVEGSANGGR
jgi:hypothetical protein